MLEAWQLRVQVGGQEQRYRFTRPEAAAEILAELAPQMSREPTPPLPESLHRLSVSGVLREGDLWSVRRADLTDREFLALPLG